MLEIIILFVMCKNMGQLVRRNGRRPFGFQLLLIGMWFGGELVGGLLGTIATTMIDGRYEGVGPLTYLCALVCAGIGAWLAFHIARSASSEADRRGFQVLPVESKPLTPAENTGNEV
jgi:hypothetical protein